jgi:hypothetical protein
MKFNPMLAVAGIAIVGALFAAPALAQTATDPAVLAPIKQLSEGFNSNSPAKIAGAHVASPIILDEFAPYSWSGATAVPAWGADFGKFAVSRGVLGGVVQINDPTLAEVNGDHAYVVAPSVITFKTKDGQMKNAGTFTFALVKQADGWKIQSWAYTRGAALP